MALPTSLAPGLLLASGQLGDPFFERSVVVLARHDERGSLGWVVNGKRLASLRDILKATALAPELDRYSHSPALEYPARFGGPVERSSGWVLYRRSELGSFEGEMPIGDDIGITAHLTALRSLLQSHRPHDFLFLLGYAGWGPEQLESEVAEGAWLPARMQADLLFSEDEEMWAHAYDRTLGGGVAAFTSTRGGSA
jgi:putative transcriptional regulator